MSTYNNCYIKENVTLGKNVVISDGCHIESGCVIGNNVTLGKNVYVDYNCIIRDNVSIADETTVGSDCILGEYGAEWYDEHNTINKPLIIGKKSIIRSGSIIYAGSSIGDYFQTGHRITIRENTIMGEHCSVGTLSDIQGNCTVGHYVRMHSNVHVGMDSKIGSFVWIYPYTVLTNDPTPPSEIVDGVVVENFVVIATSSTILPGVILHSDSLIAAGATVGKDVDSGTVVGGTPAKVISKTEMIKNRKTGERVYPWRYHFDRGMPWKEEGFDKWFNKLSVEEIKKYGFN